MSLEECKRKRANIKRNISRIKSIVDVIKDAEDKPWHAELQCRLGILESYFKQALSVQAEIEDLIQQIMVAQIWRIATSQLN